MDVDLADDYAFFFERAPGGDVGVVVEGGDDDFVASFQLAADGASEREGDGGHVLAEDDFIGVAVEKIRHGGARGGDHGIVGAAGGEGPAGVGVGGEEIILYRVHDLLGDLRARGAIEERGGLAVHLQS
jgi:hypothetical protein